MRKAMVGTALALVLSACGPEAPAFISESNSCSELHAIWDDADADFHTAYDAGDEENMDRSLAVQNSALARMEELGCP